VVSGVNGNVKEDATLHETGLLRHLGERMSSGELTATSLVEESLRRIDAAAELNAVIAMRTEPALREAHDVDRRRARGELLPALAGLPALIKDNTDVEGMVTTHGSLLCTHDPAAKADESVVAHLRSAGVIVIGKTNLPEFAMESFTDNRVFGATHNPWRRGMTPGGSSGGSAAALSAGLAAIATGTDGGGSTRIPAALCGLVGLKPTSGVVGSSAARLPIELSSTAPMAVTTADLALVAAHTLLPTVGDPTCVYGATRDGVARPATRIVVTHRIAGSAPVDPQVAQAFEGAAHEVAKALGCAVEHLDGPLLPAEADEHWADIYATEDSWSLGWERAESEHHLLDDRIAPWVDRGRHTSMRTYLTAKNARTRYVGLLDQLLVTGTVLLTPTLAVLGLPADGRIDLPADEPVPINLFNTAALNLTGHPAVNVPAGFVDDMPFGIQFVGARGSDFWLLELAAAWERANPWPLASPGYTPLV
jgi:Asp-tRNA(Asn)/Glu-tRNA(Gln) amidotransferase A subunit family amidase